MRDLRGLRYLKEGDPEHQLFKRFVVEELPYLDFKGWCRWAGKVARLNKAPVNAFIGCNDRFFLLTCILGRKDALNPWLFARCREVEENPDGRLDLWARYHYKSSIGTFAGVIQEVLCDPEIKVAILSCTKDVAKPFLIQIQEEFENNEFLKDTFSDVLWKDPRREASRWSRDTGIVVKRAGNPKEATIEAHGLIDGQPTSRHYDLLVYDDIVTQDLVGTPEVIQKVTARWELSDNLGSHKKTRKWHWGTRYSFGDTYGLILERGILKSRIYPATVDGTLKSDPVFLTKERWNEVKNTQRSTVNAQMLLNPIAGNEATFRSEWFKTYLVRPAILNVYIMCDPSKGTGERSDRTAIAVIGVDVGANKYLLDGVRHRMKLKDRYDFIKRLEAKWSAAPGVQLCRVGYERYGMQTDLEVIEEWQQRDEAYFGIDELNTPRQGKHAKNDRIERLEPDIRGGRFYFPGVVWHAEIGGQDGSALWLPWTQDLDAKAEQRGTERHPIGHIVYRPMVGPTKLHKQLEETGQHFRVVKPIKRLDEDNNVYDVTRAFIEEAMFFPFAPKKDLLDAASRVYDMEPKAPKPFEHVMSEPKDFPDA